MIIYNILINGIKTLSASYFEKKKEDYKRIDKRFKNKLQLLQRLQHPTYRKPHHIVKIT